MNPRMPPLPFSPYLYTEWVSATERKSSTMYTADQLLSAQRAAWNAAIQCAMEEMQRQRQKWDGPFYRCSEVLEEAIRSLKESE